VKSACRKDHSDGDRQFFLPSTLWVVTPWVLDRHIMTDAKIIYLKPVTVGERLPMSELSIRYRAHLTGTPFRFKYDPRTSPAIDSWPL